MTEEKFQDEFASLRAAGMHCAGCRIEYGPDAPRDLL
jgi:hypothetical protein